VRDGVGEGAEAVADVLDGLRDLEVSVDDADVEVRAALRDLHVEATVDEVHAEVRREIDSGEIEREVEKAVEDAADAID
jgi:DnaJ-domain-containing protein 1